MSHRSALNVSIVLTVILAIGIFAGRDRLFESTADAVPSSIAPAPAASLDDAVRGSEQPAISTAPRVIEIPLPATDLQSAFGNRDDEDQRARDSDGEHERDWDDDDEHEENDDD